MSAFAKVIGVPEVLKKIGEVAGELQAGAEATDAAIAEAMVSEMRARVPRDTGRLLNGIEQYPVSGGKRVVKASAVDPKGRKGGTAAGADYASFVEYGTGGGGRAADDDFFAGQSRGF